MLQPDFFEYLSHDPLEQENAPQLDMHLDAIQILRQCERDSPYSRARIVQRINLCLRGGDIKITVAQMNKWLSPSQAHTFPFWLGPAFCWATQTMAPYSVMFKPLDCKVADARDDLMSQVTAKKIMAAQQQREAKALEQRAMNAFLRGSK